MRDRPEPDRGELADQQVGGEDQRRGQQEVLRANPAQRRDLGRLLTGRGGGRGAELLQVDLVGVREVSQMGREGGALQVREDAADRVAPARIDGRLQRSVRADEDGAGDKELGEVDVERGLGSAEGCRREVDEHRPVLDHEHVARVEPTMRDPRTLEPCDLLHQALEHVVGHLLRREALERREVGLARDHQRVAGGPESRGDDFGHPHPGLCGEEGGQGFVLDLLQPPHRHAPRRVAVGEGAPAAGQPLGVLRVPAQHPHLQRSSSTVVPQVLGRAHPLRERRAQVSRVDCEGRERVSDVRRRRDACRGSEDQSHQRGGTEAKGQGGQYGRRQRGGERDRTERGQGDEPGSEQAHRPDELGTNHHEHARRGRQPQLRVTPLRQQVRIDGEPVGDDGAAQEHGRPHEQHGVDEQVPHEVPASSQQYGDDDHRGQRQEADEDRAPHRPCPAEDRFQRLRDVLVVPGRLRRDHRGQPEHDGSGGENDGVDRSPVAATRFGLRQQVDVPGTISWSCSIRLLATHARRRHVATEYRSSPGQSRVGA